MLADRPLSSLLSWSGTQHRLSGPYRFPTLPQGMMHLYRASKLAQIDAEKSCGAGRKWMESQAATGGGSGSTLQAARGSRGVVFEKPQSVRTGAAEGPVTPVRGSKQPAASASPGGQVRIQAEGYTSDGRRKKKERKKGKKRQRVDQEAVQSNIQRVLAELKGGGKKRRKGKGSAPTKEEREAAEEEARQEQELAYVCIEV